MSLATRFPLPDLSSMRTRTVSPRIEGDGVVGAHGSIASEEPGWQLNGDGTIVLPFAVGVDVDRTIGAGGTTTSASYATLNASYGIDFTKQHDDTVILVVMTSRFHCGTASETAKLGISINNVEYDVAEERMTAIAVPQRLTGIQIVAGLAAGDYPGCLGLWKISGGATLTHTVGGLSSMFMAELATA